MRKALTLGVAFLALILFILTQSSNLLAQQKIDKATLDTALGILHDAYDCKKNYYDPTLHGLDWDARYHEYETRMHNATSLGQAFGTVYAFIGGLKDTHVFFQPPDRALRHDYGYRMQLFGDNCFIIRVRPGTDAESKVHPGDQVVHFNGFDVNRADFEDMRYYFQTLSPLAASNLDLRDPAGTTRQLTVDAKIRQLKRQMDLTGDDFWTLIRQDENVDHVLRSRIVEMGDVAIWKMPGFFLNDEEVDRGFGIVRKHKILILDLRENGGGAVSTLDRMIGNIFDHDVKIADRVGRKQHKPELAKTRGGSAFNGKVIVLVDSDSASCSELFARLIQLEHRGTVIGDRTAGAVMEAIHYPFTQGVDTKIFYGFSVTEADVIMSDGKSLEHAGVVPDEVMIPTGQDLAAGRDPVLAHAVEVAGFKIDPASAGKMFPFEWQPF